MPCERHLKSVLIVASQRAGTAAAHQSVQQQNHPVTPIRKALTVAMVSAIGNWQLFQMRAAFYEPGRRNNPAEASSHHFVSMLSMMAHAQPFDGRWHIEEYAGEGVGKPTADAIGIS
jgi:hypothetical protein